MASPRRTARYERIPPDGFDTAALEVTLCGGTPPPPNGGSPRTERSPLPCGHLPTPWGVTPFRGGLCKRIASKENRLIQYLVTFYIVFGKSNRTAIVNVKTYCVYFLVIFIFSDTRKCTVADIYSSTFTRATPHKARLTALHAICLQIFRHIAQKSLAIRQYACGISMQSAEKSDYAPYAQALCGVALTIFAPCPSIKSIFCSKSHL